MVETDCPYLAPQLHRGETNEPSYVVEVVKQIAEIKQLPYEEVVKISTNNAELFYGV
jgi:TatD DNase family protein